MNANTTNCLLMDVSPATKSRILESLFPNNKTCYADEITNNLDSIRRVISALSKMSELPQEENCGVGGEIALAVSELIQQQLDITIALVQGAAFEKSKLTE
jgi:hypothetical protein